MQYIWYCEESAKTARAGESAKSTGEPELKKMSTGAGFQCQTVKVGQLSAVTPLCRLHQGVGNPQYWLHQGVHTPRCRLHMGVDAQWCRIYWESMANLLNRYSKSKSF